MKKAFTLIELVIAIILVTLILFGVMYFFKARQSTSNSKSSSKVSIERVLNVS